MHTSTQEVENSFTELQRRMVVSRLRSGETVSQVSKELDLHVKHIHAICALEKRREHEEIVKAEIEETVKERLVEHMTKNFEKSKSNRNFSEIREKVLEEVANGVRAPIIAKKYNIAVGSVYNWKKAAKQKKTVPAKKAAKVRLPHEAARTPPPIIHHSKIRIDKYEDEMRRLWMENMNLRIELMKYT